MSKLARRRELSAAGLEVSWLTDKQLKKATKLEAPGAMRLRDAFSLDPYRACVGLATAAAREKAQIFEK